MQASTQIQCNNNYLIDTVNFFYDVENDNAPLKHIYKYCAGNEDKWTQLSKISW